MAVTVGVATIGLEVGGLYMQYEGNKENKQAARENAAESRAQAAAQQRMADIKNARDRAMAAREATIARGSVENNAAAAGTSFSSGAQGGLASISTQESTNIGIFNALESNQHDITSSQIRQSSAIERQAGAQARIFEGQALYTIGSDVFKSTGGFKTIFDSAKTSGTK